MTIETIIEVTTAVSIIGLARPKAGNVNVWLWTAAKAVQSKQASAISAAIARMAELDADGSFELLATDTQLAMTQVIMANFSLFGKGDLTAVKERRVTNAAAAAVKDLQLAVLRNAQYEF
jgi:hypothetical protein